MVFLYCKLCGKHLYKNISFKNIFKLDYQIHDECEKLLNVNSSYITVPFMDKLLLIDYLFEEKSAESDVEFLYEKYSYLYFDRLLCSEEWSIVLIVDEVIEEIVLVLVTKLAEKALLIFNVFNGNFM